jgi:hypothetical protein
MPEARNDEASEVDGPLPGKQIAGSINVRSIAPMVTVRSSRLALLLRRDLRGKIPRQQLIDPVDRVLGDATEHMT